MTPTDLTTDDLATFWPCVLVVYAEDQPEYLPLPSARRLLPDPEDRSAPVVSRWRLSDAERAAIAAGGDVYLELLTFGDPLQPIRLVVDPHTLVGRTALASDEHDVSNSGPRTAV